VPEKHAKRATKEEGEKKEPLDVLEHCADIIRNNVGAGAKGTYRLQLETFRTACIEGQLEKHYPQR